MVTNESILEWYMRGFNDELKGSSSLYSKNEIENTAYRIGALDAFYGDDMRSTDYESDQKVLEKIKNAFNDK